MIVCFPLRCSLICNTGVFRIDVDLAARRLQQLPLLSKTGLPPLPQNTIPTVLKLGSLPPLPSILNLPSAPKSENRVSAAILSQELVVDGGGKRKGIEGMVVEIVGIKREAWQGNFLCTRQVGNARKPR
ncbi:hypothetical protein V6N11_010009 [Hibiscus sabdariffa]|uniref:Uncharacterized protein n=1 Tax=Hibiscus sabdariffa TaxID=183260 RepID=A0ABR2PDC9_9ROSI